MQSAKGHLTMVPKILILSCLIAFSALQESNAVSYVAVNTAENTTGGVRYDTEISLVYSINTLSSAADFIWRVFQQNTLAERKDVERLTLIVEPFDGVAFAVNDEIHVSSGYVGGYSGDVRTEITGVLYHESTHIWQWDGKGQAPGGLIEGIADYMRLKAGFAPSHWVKPGQGDRWDQGYDVTARFLDYCNELRNGFVAVLNEKMKTGYEESYFVDIVGKSVDQLWTDYKAKYGTA